MSQFIEVFEFIYNNFVVVGIIVLSITLFFLVIRMFYLEYRFNKHLSMRKIISRNLELYRFQQLTLRRFLAILLPIALIVLILIQAFVNVRSVEENSVILNDESDVLSVYENFFGKFLTTPFQPDIEDPIELTESARVDQINTYENVDFVARLDNRVFVLNSNGVDIVRVDGRDSQHIRRLPLMNFACEAEQFFPEGLFIHEETLVVIVSFAEGQCENRIIPYHLREHSVKIYLFDLNNPSYPKIHDYQISGILTNLRQDDGQMLLSTSTYLAFTDPNFALNRSLPTVVHNGDTSVLPISGMRYVEGTVPNSFVAVHRISLDTHDVDSTALLTDFNHQLRLLKDRFILLYDSYLFAPASEIFELRNPVERIRTAVSKFTVDETLTYQQTLILEGEKRPFSLNISVEDTIVITREPIHYRIHLINNDFDQVIDSLVLPRFLIDDMLYDQRHLYFVPRSPVNPVVVFGIGSTGKFEQVRELEELVLLDHLVRLNRHRVLGASNLQNNMISINMIRQQTPTELFVGWQTIIDYSEFGYQLEENRNPLQDLVVFLYQEQEYMLLPLQSAGVVNIERDIQDAMVLYTLNPGGIQEVESFRLGGLEAFRFPFAYRSLVDGDYWIHITPGGLVVSPRDNLSQRDATIRFNP